MKKIILGILIGIGVSISLISIKAEWVQSLADNPKVATFSNDDNTVHRFEWYGDVCYTATGGGGNTMPVAISCIKH